MYSDNLAMFACKKLDPSFRDNFVIGSAVGPTSVSFIFAPSDFHRSPSSLEKPTAGATEAEEAQVIAGTDEGKS
jgi:hypothetical protein